MATAQLPASIEIFRPGRHTDDQGVVREFTPADLAAIAAGYDRTLREAPLTIGHPAHDRPAYGWVDGVHVTPEGRLAISPRDAEPQFAEMVAARRFPKRSAAFYPPGHPGNPTPGRWYLRHVAFLGAQPPAIAGLKDIQFADDAAGLVCFSEAGTVDSDPGPSTQEPPAMTDQEKAALARAEKAEAEAKAAAEARATAEAAAQAATAQLAQFAEQQRAATHASHVAFAEAELKAGRLLPQHKEPAIAVLDLLADAQPVEFAEAGATKKIAPVEWLKGLIGSAQPAVQFGEFAGAAPDVFLSASGMSDADIDKRARAYAAKHNVSYAEALGNVATFTV